tara:strand:- start:24230 stop:25246 length:1017 start_codon:yes stop_codon:yes gene_type:complete
MVAERFIDTWTKLRVFDLHSMPQRWERLCWLDADMMVFSDPSPLIFNERNDDYLSGGDGMRLMAVHTCVCNLDHDAWAPPSWVPANCAMAKLANPEQLAKVEAEPETLSNFNSGTFVYRPTPALAHFVRRAFDELGNASLRRMKFPDQDFLNHAFDGRWAPLSWRTNALKTWRYWHANLWKDELVAVLHYIVDKPWAARVAPDGAAGYLGKDGATHRWWWDEYDTWETARRQQGEMELVDTVGRYVASETGEVGEEMRAVGGGAQGWAKKFEGKRGEDKEEGQKEEGKQEEEQEGFGEGLSGPVLRKPMLGERGHGPVVRGRGLGGRGRGEGWCVMEN